MSARESNRVKDADKRRVLDEAARNRRARKALEALEQDNFHDDPHADLVMSKKVPKFHDSLQEQSRGGNTAGGIGGAGVGGSGGGGSHNTSGTKNKRKNADYIKAKYRKTFAQLLEEDRNGGSSGRYAASGGGGVDDEPDPTAAAANNNNNSSSSSSDEQRVTYANAAAPPSQRPPRHFCAVCGFPSTYTCTSCGVRYCCIKCLGTHRDTRCLKWTA